MMESLSEALLELWVGIGLPFTILIASAIALRVAFVIRRRTIERRRTKRREDLDLARRRGT